MADPTPSRLHVIRDTTLWVAGLLGIGYQTVTKDVNPVLTGAFMAMLGLPGIAGVVSAVRSTTESQSEPPSSSSPSSSTSPVSER